MSQEVSITHEARATCEKPDMKAHQHSRLISMSRLLIDVADLAGYAEPGTAPMDLDTLHIAREYAGL